MEFGQSAVEDMVMHTGFWKNKKVFLTGHTGFKGGWLSLWLQGLGADITGFSLKPPSGPNFFESARVAEEMNSIIADVRDFARLRSAVQKSKPEIIIHMAAQPLVRYSYDNPVETYAVNVMGTAHVLEAARKTDTVRAILIVTSDKCYENREWCWGYRENEPMGGHDPYSSSKGCAELVTAAYTNSYFSGAGAGKNAIAAASARAGNVLGGGDWSADRILPDAIKAFLRNQPLIIRNPGAVRPWQHVLEPLAGYLRLAEKLRLGGKAYAGGWNFGPDDGAQPVSWIADAVVTLWGGCACWAKEKNAKASGHEARYLKLDCSKAKRYLGWRPKLALETALEWTVDWYRACRDRKDMRAFSESQIGKYENLKHDV